MLNVLANAPSLCEILQGIKSTISDAKLALLIEQYRIVFYMALNITGISLQSLAMCSLEIGSLQIVERSIAVRARLSRV